MSDEARSAILHYAVRNFPQVNLDGDMKAYTDKYFLRTAATLEHAGHNPRVVMQVFAKKAGILCGVNEVLKTIFRLCGPTLMDLEIETLLEGDEISPFEPVMHIRGHYRAIAYLETIILGVLARRTLVASNARAAVEAANGKDVYFMGARHEDWRVQQGDGYAATIGGVVGVSTDANGEWTGLSGMGTMPHAMIAAFNGRTTDASIAFARYVKEHEPDTKIVSLVDYSNDVITTSLAVCYHMKRQVGILPYAVRVDTSENLVDQSIIEDLSAFGTQYLNGVNPLLIKKLRKALDYQDYSDVKIIVSGGFTPAKIRKFEEENTPVDGYGVGSSILGHNNGANGLYSGFDFTADIVKVNGALQSKVGRKFISNDRLVRVNWYDLW